jgi:GT2 family glycosyltransferase
VTVPDSPPRAAPRVTVIVLNWCNEPETAECVESLLASRYDALTILIIDNASPDGSGPALHARFPRIPYLQTGANLGYAGGNNRGFEWALEHGAEYVMVLNDDTVVDRVCVAKLVETAERTGAAVVAPQILYFHEPETVWYGGGRYSVGRGMGLHLHENGPAQASESATPVTFVCGCCFLVRADVLRDVGGFDESFFAYVEDAEFSLRLVRRGYNLMYQPAARVWHRLRRGAEETPFQIRQRDRNRRRMVRLHYGSFDRARFALWFYPTRLMHLARFVARGEWAKVKALVDGMTSPL